MDTKRTFYIKTFGCQMNYADSEKIHRILLQAGFLKVLDASKADVIILNTCSVRQKGEDRVFGFVREIRKSDKELQKKTLIGITGCMVRKTGIAKAYLGENIDRKQTKTITLESGFENWDDPLLLRSSDIDFVFRIEETGGLTKILSHLLNEDIGNDEKWEEYLKIKQVPEQTGSANVIIQTGCDNFCSYCIVPYTRGRELSRPISEILSESKEAQENGAKEITLLGQNVNSYGKETKKKLWDSEMLTWNTGNEKTPFRELLEELGKIEGLDRIRFTSSNPHDMTKDILDAHFDVPHLCNYLHFALQSGSDKVLKAMNRKHTLADFQAQVEYLRSRDPLFSISTDIIVWFPGESEEDFECTKRAMEEIMFDFAYIARYSVRSGTSAAKNLEDDVSAREKARRWNTLNEVLRKNVYERNSLMLDRVEEILISWPGREDGEKVGRTRNFKEVFFYSKAPIGSLVSVKLTDIDGWILRGSEI